MSLYEIACNCLNRTGIRSLMNGATRERIIERWELSYSESLGQWGNPERENWIWIERREDWFSEDSVSCCVDCDGLEAVSDSVDVYRFTRGRRELVTFCEPCSEETNFCDSCGERFVNCALCFEYEGAYCPSCYESERDRREEEDEDELSGYVSEYHSRSRPSAPSEMAWSVEIEMEFSDFRTREAFAIEARSLTLWGEHRLILERDGSLDSSRGIECILSCYTSMDALKHDIKALQECATKHRAIAWDLQKVHGREAGIHISTNRIGWSKHSLMRLGYILTVCQDALAKQSGRRSHYAEYLQRHSEWSLYQNRWHTPLADFARGTRGKYCAVNVRDSRLEWRIFRSTLSHERMQKNLALVLGLEALAKSKSPCVSLKREALEIIKTNTL